MDMKVRDMGTMDMDPGHTEARSTGVMDMVTMHTTAMDTEVRVNGITDITMDIGTRKNGVIIHFTNRQGLNYSKKEGDTFMILLLVKFVNKVLMGRKY